MTASAAAAMPNAIDVGQSGARQRLLRGWRHVEQGIDRLAGEAANPLRHLGAIGFGLFWLLAISGIYLYAVLDTSAAGAHASIEALSHEQPWAGGLLRSLHRYAADSFVVVVGLHLLREWLFGHYRNFRRFSWLTGVPLLAFTFVSAVGGFWLNWDQLGQFSAQASAELLDWWPFFASPMTRNFLSGEAVGDRLFSLFVFIHLGVPMLLVFGLWFHVQRISHAAVFPPRRLASVLLAALGVLAWLRPVLSGPAADLSRVPTLASFDWLLLAVHPLQYATSAGTVWALLGTALLLLLALPFVPQRAAREQVTVAGAGAVTVAVVDPANCNGCRRCFDDCPYAAVTMIPHPNARFKQMAQVDADLCASCGICAGACPSSTPFRSVPELVTGIDMPQAPVSALRERLRNGLAAADGVPTIVVFGCEQGARSQTLAAADVLTLNLICTGALPPSFVEYALRDGAAGVLVAHCRSGGCEFRLGAQWTEERLRGAREPHLRASVSPGRYATVAADAGEEPRLQAAMRALRLQLRTEPIATHEATHG